jgi:ketosteroid isomerase-like protein
MRARRIVLLASLALGCAQKPPGHHVQPIVSAERAFSERSVERGTKAAFLEFLAADSTVFAPGPLPGRAFYQSAPDVAGKLAWKPSYAEISAGADFGYATGPYTLTHADGRLHFGHYATVWRRHGRAWQVVVEGVTRHAPPLQVDESLTYLPAAKGRGARKVVVAAELRRLEAAERVLLHAWKARGSAALLEYATDDVRYLPADALPMHGRGAVQAGLRVLRDEMSFEPAGGGVAPSGDLGYTVGAVTRRPGPSAPVASGGYLRVWRRSARGVWLVALELHAIPPRTDVPTVPTIAAPPDEPAFPDEPAAPAVPGEPGVGSVQ